VVAKNPELEREIQELDLATDSEKRLLALFASMETKKRKDDRHGNEQ
jgi:hypothetical protein